MQSDLGNPDKTQECGYQRRTKIRPATHLHAPVEGGGGHTTQLDLYSLGMRTLCLHFQHSMRKPSVEGEMMEGNQTFNLCLNELFIHQNI